MKESSEGDIRVRFLNTRIIPSPAADNLRYGGNTSCVELRFGRELLILDAGSGLRLLGEQLMEEAAGRPIKEPCCFPTRTGITFRAFLSSRLAIQRKTISKFTPPSVNRVGCIAL